MAAVVAIDAVTVLSAFHVLGKTLTVTFLAPRFLASAPFTTVVASH